MKKIFIVAGELSGDKLGGWYVKKFSQNKNIHIEAVGGDFLQEAGAHIFHRFEDLNVTGIIEIIKKLPFILKFLKYLAAYITQNNFDEIILIDFPGFNLKLAKLLKRKIKNISITYLSPPQLWCWGAWRIKKLKKYCDRLIVLYPFEVQWYADRGVKAVWLGSPVYDSLEHYFDLADQPKKNCIALMPGSRATEIENMFHVFAGVMEKFLKQYPDVTFVIPMAQSLSQELIEKKLQENSLDKYSEKITIIFDEKKKFEQVSQCCLAITKPGTVTLDLALLGVSAVVLFKTSWINYFLARPLVKVNYMALPNLLLPRPMYKEFIQHDCTPEKIYKHAQVLYQNFLDGGVGRYQEIGKKSLQLRTLLSGQHESKK